MAHALVFLFVALPFFPALNVVPGADVASLRVVVFSLGVFGAALALTRRKLFVPTTPQLLAIGAFFLFGLASALWAEAPSFSFRKALFFLSLSPIPFLLVASPIVHRDRFLSAIVWGAGASALGGLAIFFSQFLVGSDILVQSIGARIAPFLFGYETAQAVSLFPSWFVDIGSGKPLMRAFLPFPDPHTAALFWGTAFFVACGLWSATRGPARRSFLVILALLFLALIASYSRGAYVAFLATFILLATRRALKRNSPNTTRRYMYALGGFLVLLLFLSAALPQTANRFFLSFDIAEGSAAARLVLWQEAIAVFLDHPIIGVGLGNFAQAHDPFLPYRAPTNAHSTYLEVAAELGIAGIAFFLFAILSARRSALREARHGSAAHAAVFAGLTFFAAHALFEVDLYHPANLVVFLTLLTLAGFPHKIQNPTPKPQDA